MTPSDLLRMITYASHLHGIELLMTAKKVDQNEAVVTLSVEADGARHDFDVTVRGKVAANLRGEVL